MKRDTTSQQKQGFVKLMRSPSTIELLRDLLAFGLLALIAFRARWRSAFSADGLQIGEALIGDYKKIGMTRREYRTRVARLLKWGLITVDPTRKGTVAKLASNAVFDINVAPTTGQQTVKNRPSKRPTDLPLKNRAEGPTERPTDDQQTANRRPLTNNDKKGRKKEYQGTGKALGSSTPGPSSSRKRGSVFLVENYQNQNQPVQSHVKWSEFAEWCRRKGGTPTESGFWKWLLGQKPQWRNKIRQNFDESGYVLDGKFFPAEQANQLATQNPDLIPRFRKAIKHDSKVQIILSLKENTENTGQ